jgi:thioredoxin 1
MAAEKVQVLTGTNFDQIVGGVQPVLVDFWAEWCGPCRMMSPAIDDLASHYDGRAVIAKVNVDEYPEIAGRYGIRSIPTLLVFKKGEVVESTLGVQSSDTLKRMIDKHV